MIFIKCWVSIICIIHL